MLIGIDASRANKAKKTGVEWYAYHLIQQLKQLTTGSDYSWVLYTNTILRGGLEYLPASWYEVRAKWFLKKGWTQMRLSWELWRRPTDVFFVPAHVLPRVSPQKSVVTVHDVGFHRYPQLYRSRDRRFHEWSTRDIAKRSARIITVSEFSGREIVELYGVDPSRIAITPNGIDHETYRPITDPAIIDSVLRKHRIVTPYFISIGRLEAKKNIVNLIKAFTLFKARRGVGDPTKLVLVGSPGYGYEDIKRVIADSNVHADIIQLGYVIEEDLPVLLSAARALVHPSWYEGFGIPPIQAMACGCPVVSSDVASLPEVIGPEAGLYFPPDQIEAIVQALVQVSDDTTLITKLKKAGLLRAQRYTWRATAEKTLPVLTNW